MAKVARVATTKRTTTSRVKTNSAPKVARTRRTNEPDNHCPPKLRTSIRTGQPIRWASVDELNRSTNVGSDAWREQHPEFRQKSLSAWRNLHRPYDHEEIQSFARSQGIKCSSNLPLSDMINIAAGHELAQKKLAKQRETLAAADKVLSPSEKQSVVDVAGQPTKAAADAAKADVSRPVAGPAKVDVARPPAGPAKRLKRPGVRAASLNAILGGRRPAKGINIKQAAAIGLAIALAAAARKRKRRLAKKKREAAARRAAQQRGPEVV